MYNNGFDANSSFSLYGYNNNGIGGGPFDGGSGGGGGLDYAGYISKGDFMSRLNTEGLTSSYNSFNLADALQSLGNSEGNIGGVATKAGTMENILNTDAETEDDWIICLKSEGENVTFSND